MADNTVVIKIDVRADTAEIDRVKRKLAALRGEAELLSDEFGDLGDGTDELDDSLGSVGKTSRTTGHDFRNLGRDTNKLEKRFSFLDKFVKKSGETLQKVFKFGFKVLMLNIAGMAAGLLAVNAAFAVGRFAVQAWHASLTVAAAAGASFVAVLSSIAAGQREYNAALQAYNYRYSPGLKAGTQEAMSQLRALSTNTQLAVLGAEALNGAFAALSSKTQVNGTLQAALTAMGDFAASAADPSKAFVAAGDFLGSLIQTGKIDDNITKLADEVGPKFAEAIAASVKNGKTGSFDILQSLIGGDLARSVGVEDQLEAINDTLFGTAKRNFQLIKEQFADLGQAFLPGFSDALNQMGRIVSRFLISIGGAVRWFGNGNMIDGLLGAFDKLATWTADVFNKYLPRTEGMIDTLRGWGESVGKGWSIMVEALRPLLDGARVLMDAFGPLFKSIFTEFGGGVRDFGELLEDNRGKVMQFGQSAYELFHSFSDLFGAMKAALVQALPIISTIMDGISEIVKGITSFVQTLNKLGSGGSLVALTALLAGYVGLGQIGKAGKKGVAGKIGGALGVGGAGAYTINAATVYVNGGIIQGGAGGMAGGAATGAATSGWRQRAAGLYPVAGGILAGAGAYGLSKSNSAWQSGLSGAATGAGIGLMLGGPMGAAIGTGVGAAGGLIFDSLFGEPTRNKNLAKDTATQYNSEQEKKIVEAIAAGNTDTAEALLQWDQGRSHVMQAIMAGYDEYGTYNGAGGSLGKEEYLKEFRDERGVINEQEYQALLKASDTFIDTLFEQEFALRQKYNPALDQLTKNLDALSEATGMSKTEVNDLAQSLGIDLTSQIESSVAFFEEAFNTTIPQSIEELAQKSSDIFLHALDAATQPNIALQEGAEAVNQATSALFEQVRAGTFDPAAASKYLQDVATYEYQQTYNPLTGTYDPIEALREITRNVGAGGAQYNTEGSLLYGMEDQIVPLLGPVLANLTSGVASELGPTLMAVIGQGSLDKFGAATDFGAYPTNPANLSLDQLGNLQSAATAVQNAPTAVGTAITGAAPALGNSVRAALAGASIRVNVAVSGQISGATTTVTQSGGGGTSKQPAFGTATPPMIAAPGGDTPTSRLTGILARHNLFGSKIAGRRQITSGVRGTNLGSLGSDHLSGNAYDMVGDNLGAYKTAVEKAGGFAELHGRGNDRHLHVASGDTASPLAGGGMSGGAGNQYVFQINSTPNATPQQIIDEAMRQIDRRNRERKERG